MTTYSEVAWSFRVVELRGDVRAVRSRRRRSWRSACPSRPADNKGFVSLRQPATFREDRYAIGRSLRKRTPRSTLGGWSVPTSMTPTREPGSGICADW
jgi:hypothetical protein